LKQNNLTKKVMDLLFSIEDVAKQIYVNGYGRDVVFAPYLVIGESECIEALGASFYYDLLSRRNTLTPSEKTFVQT